MEYPEGGYTPVVLAKSAEAIENRGDGFLSLTKERTKSEKGIEDAELTFSELFFAERSWRGMREEDETEGQTVRIGSSLHSSE